ncbi:hypothetical protein CI102_14452 [Trichoderma harzianum]|nr:hypothetical protein CI102_14452 [Trichoderma harzianum]
MKPETTAGNCWGSDRSQSAPAIRSRVGLPIARAPSCTSHSFRRALAAGQWAGQQREYKVQVLARAGGVREVKCECNGGTRPVWRYKRYKPGSTRTSSQGGRVQQVCGTCHQSSASYRIASNRIGSQSHRASPSGLVVSLAVAPIDCLAVAETETMQTSHQSQLRTRCRQTLLRLEQVQLALRGRKRAKVILLPPASAKVAQRLSPTLITAFVFGSDRQARQSHSLSSASSLELLFFLFASFLLADDATGHGDRRRQSISLILSVFS